MPDFWRDSGFHLLDRGPGGRLVVTDDFLRAYFLRPEVRPVEESCPAERALHERLLAEPRAAVSPGQLSALADPDARENYRIVLGLRDRLARAGAVEDCYLGCIRDRAEEPGQRVPVPPLFIDQMAHVVARAVLDGCRDALRVRAAELLFREQRIILQDGGIMAADAETVAMHAAGAGFGSLGRLIVEARTPLRRVELDVLGEDNADLYWGRDQRYDTVLMLNFAAPGLDALCRVLEAWVRHFLDVEVGIQPVQKITDEKWVWHVGLDAEASRLLNDLYDGAEVDEERFGRLLSLFRLEFAEPSVMLAGIAGRPVYLGMCMTAEGILRLKPQNLLVNLPLAEQA